MTDRLYQYGAPLGGYIDPVTGKLSLDIGGPSQASTRVKSRQVTSPAPVDTNLITAPGMGSGTYPEPLAKLRHWFDPETYGPTGGATWEQPSALLPMAMHPGPGGRPEEKPAIPRAFKEAAQYGIDLLASPWTGGVPESFVAGTAMNALTGAQSPSQLGMFLGKTAKNFPTEAAATAKQMLKEGMDVPFIYKTTGVDPKGIKSTAKNPFFEISDAERAGVEYRPGGALGDAVDRTIPSPDSPAYAAQVKAAEDAGWGTGHDALWRAARDVVETRGYRTTVGELLPHPELFANHPELANLPVHIGPRGAEGGTPSLGKGYSGAYVHGKGVIELSGDVAANLDQGKSTLLHEIQHYLQYKEGWPKGGNIAMMEQIAQSGTGAAFSLRIRDFIKKKVPAGQDPIPYLEALYPGVDIRNHSLVQQALDPKISDTALKRYVRVGKIGAKIGEKTPDAIGPTLYRRLAGEYQSRMTERRREMPIEELRSYHPTDQARLAGEIPEQAQISVSSATGMLAGKEEPNAFFDLSNLEQVPEVPQGPLERYVPPRGISPRLQAVLENKNIQKRIKGIVEQGVKMGGQRWYNTEPLRRAFIDELGDTEGQIAYTRYMDYVAATSPRSKVPENVRNASYYYARERQGLPQPTPKPSAEFPANPKPYGHMAQALHRQNAQTIAGGGFDIFKNPKPPSFSANLQGNQFPVTVDAHATKLPAMLSQDPRWLETNVREPVPGAKGEFQNIKPPALYKSGELTVEQALEKPTYWSGQPNPNEYAGLENMYQDIAKSVGVTPAQAQASAWIAGGKLTGLGSDSAKAFMDFFQERLLFTAEQFGESPKTALRKFIRGERPLLGISMSPSAIGDTLRAMNKEQQQPPPTGNRLLQTMGTQS